MQSEFQDGRRHIVTMREHCKHDLTDVPSTYTMYLNIKILLKHITTLYPFWKGLTTCNYYTK